MQELLYKLDSRNMTRCG